nr:hypothetical protein [Elizabethkingia sp. ASV34]
MIYCVPTKKGLGVEIWGTRDDLECFYDILSKLWDNESFSSVKGYEDKNKLISSLSFEIRKASYGSRLKRSHSHFTFEEIPYLGFQISWPHILFCISALRYNMNMVDMTKMDVAMFLHLEYWIERSMNDYDTIGAKKLLPFLEGGIYAGNEYLYLYMRNINAAFFRMKGGKSSFRKLGDLMKGCTIFSEEYNDLLNFLEADAKRFNCNIEDLELDDANELYEIQW